MSENTYKVTLLPETTLVKVLMLKGEKGDSGSGGGGSGNGDMLKSVYDTNNNGIVDNAEKVNNHTVAKDVPANAVFTDTVYNDTEVRNLITAKADPATTLAGYGITNAYTKAQTDAAITTAINAITDYDEESF